MSCNAFYQFPVESDSINNSELVPENEFEELYKSLNPVVSSFSDLCICPECPDSHQMMLSNDNSYRCGSCGYTTFMLEESYEYNKSIAENCNSSMAHSMPSKVIGDRSAYGIQRSHMTTCNDYTRIRSINIKHELFRLNYTKEVKMPKDVLLRAAELYETICKFGTHRSDVRGGLIGACIGIECSRVKYTRKIQELAEFMNVEQTKISSGMNYINTLHAQGKIKIYVTTNPIKDFVNRYFDCLGINPYYKKFVLHVIKIHAKNNIGEVKSKPSTRTVGAIYVLSDCLKLNIPASTIIKECKTSKSTFIAFSKQVYENIHMFKRAFKKYNVPLPSNNKINKKKLMKPHTSSKITININTSTDQQPLMINNMETVQSIQVS